MKTCATILLLLLSASAGAAPNPPIYLFERSSPTVGGASPRSVGADESDAYSEAASGDAFAFERRAPNDAVNESSRAYACAMDLGESEDRGFDEGEGDAFY